MSTLREAAEKALKALDVATTPLAKDRQEVLSAMAALRAELAKPDAPMVPVGWVLMTTGLSVGVFSAGASCPPGWSGLNVRAVFDQGATPRPAPAEPQPAAQQEPLCMCKDRALSACPGEWEPGCDLGNNPAHARPAGYTQAGERKPLTDEQIDRHSIAAVDCPPSSTVILVSSLRRLLGITATKGER